MRALALAGALLAAAGHLHAQAWQQDTIAAARDRHARTVLERIAGREQLPADSVFRNIEMMKGVPAGRLVRIMQMGYARSLGVSCDHCHDTDEWESDAKPQKDIARRMMAMVDTINRVLLPRIPDLESERPVVNCTTCHRGAVKPALDLGPPAQRSGQ